MQLLNASWLTLSCVAVRSGATIRSWHLQDKNVLAFDVRFQGMKGPAASSSTALVAIRSDASRMLLKTPYSIDLAARKADIQ